MNSSIHYCEKRYGRIFGNFDETKISKNKKAQSIKTKDSKLDININKVKLQEENVKRLSYYNSNFFNFEIYFDHSLNAGKFFSGNENKHTFFFNNNILGGENWEVKELEVYKIIYI